MLSLKEKQYHFIGIGGSGMSGLAALMLQSSCKVSGSDLFMSQVTDALASQGADVHEGHRACHIKPGMAVVYNTEIRSDNPEFLAAKALQCPLLHRSQCLQMLMEGSLAIAVAGTHGKTTTSALLAYVLAVGGRDPSYAIGGMVPQLNGNAAKGKGEFFVAEACESDGSFLHYTPWGGIVTNIDGDHIDHYGSMEALCEAFDCFLKSIKSKENLLWCGDDPFLAKLKPQGLSYGTLAHCNWEASNMRRSGWSSSFDIRNGDKLYKDVEVALIGKHNVLNALAVFAMALSLGVAEEKIREAFKSFCGVKRRADHRGICQGVLFLDDYGHHPTEIAATLSAIRNATSERRLIAVYQQHRYSRAKQCQGLYRNVFRDADELIVTDIYSAGESPIDGVGASQLVAELKGELKERLHYVPREGVADFLADRLRPHDVVVTMGAGDVTNISDEAIKRLNAREPAKLKVGVVFGGVSVEHEISLLSARNVMAAMNIRLYDVVPLAITREGRWLQGKEAMKVLNGSLSLIEPAENGMKIAGDVMEALSSCDLFFPILHGSYGEDGTIQGLFEMLDKPYVGCDFRSAALCMDKVLTKRLMQQADIAVVPFVAFTVRQWKEEEGAWLAKIHSKLSYPLFVKPSHLGSSVGVYKVDREQDLASAIDMAFAFDTAILVEQGLKVREIEFAVIGNEEAKVFPPGEICTDGKFYDYSAKYSEHALPANPAAVLDDCKRSEGMAIALEAYRTAGCLGMARVDLFLDDAGCFWLNEINPIPGFTKNSLYPKICAHNGLDESSLVDRLIVLALACHRNKKRLSCRPMCCQTPSCQS